MTAPHIDGCTVSDAYWQARFLEGCGANREQKVELYSTLATKASRGGNLAYARFFRACLDGLEGTGKAREELLARTIAKLEECAHAINDSALFIAEVGYRRFLRGDLECRRWVERAAQLDPSYPRSWSTLGHLASARSDLQAAEGLYRKAEEMLPGFHCALFGRGMLAVLRRETARGERLFRELLRLYPGNHLADTGIAVVRALERDLEGSWCLTEQVLDEDPYQRQALELGLGVSLGLGKTKQFWSILESLESMDGQTRLTAWYRGLAADRLKIGKPLVQLGQEFERYFGFRSEPYRELVEREAALIAD